MATCPIPAADLSKGITADVARTELALWIECSRKLAKNQSWKVGDVEYRRADLGAVERMITYWNGQLVAAGASSTSRTKVVRRVW